MISFFFFFQQKFSKLVDLASSVSTMAGVTHRVSEIFELLDRLPESHDRNCEDETGFEDSESSRPLVPETKSIVQGNPTVLSLLLK